MGALQHDETLKLGCLRKKGNIQRIFVDLVQEDVEMVGVEAEDGGRCSTVEGAAKRRGITTDI